MKNLFLLIVIVYFATGCSTLKPVSSNNTGSIYNSSKKSSLAFIDNVSIKPGNSGTNSEEVVQAKKPFIEYKRAAKLNYNAPIERYTALQFKYAIIEDVAVEDMRNEKLLEFIEDWYGTKYHFGGNGKEGIDCSAFVSTLMSNVYGINNLPRVSRDQFFVTAHIPKNQLHEGDLVFFHTYGRRKTITHVGVYLRNNKFVHASVSGVMISDMSDGYYASHFVGAGRVFDVGMRDAASN